MQEGELELEAASAKAEQAADAETLRDTAPVLDANKVTSQKKPHNCPTYLTGILKFVTSFRPIQHIEDKVYKFHPCDPVFL